MKPGRYVYDVEISATDSFGVTTIERVLEGKLTVSDEVSEKLEEINGNVLIGNAMLKGRLIQ